MKKLLLLFLLITFSLSTGFSAMPVGEMVFDLHPVQESVYITKTGSKYHKETCHHLRKSKIKISKADAKNAGYSACSVCKPGYSE